MISDDRQQFEVTKREMANRMASDSSLRSLAQELLIQADHYNWAYQWTWLGLPIIQMPPDIIALQEIIWRARPQLVIETGVARGGSLLMSASILQLLGEGQVIGVDIDLREHNRLAIEKHPLSSRISILAGSSTDDEVLSVVRDRCRGNRVMVILDSDHAHDHVLRELELYSPLVTHGQYLIVADTGVDFIPPQLHRGPRSWGPGNSPMTALTSFLASNDDFEFDRELDAKLLISSSPSGYLRRRLPEH